MISPRRRSRIAADHALAAELDPGRVDYKIAKRDAQRRLDWYDALPPAARALYLSFDYPVDDLTFLRAWRRSGGDPDKARAMMAQTVEANRRRHLIAAYGSEHPQVGV